MKKLFTLSALLMISPILFAQKTYVPDDQFEQVLIDLGYDSGALDDSVATSNIITVTSLDVKGKNISDLTGIEGFQALTRLECSDNNLTNLNLSHNVLLTELTCENNRLTSLDVSYCPDLSGLWCRTNQLTILEVGNNLALRNLNCSNNQLTSIDVSKNTSLSSLLIASNQLSTLDISQNKSLTDFICEDNQIGNLDVSQNTELSYLGVGGNQLTTLDIRNNTLLNSISCGANQLTSLDLSKNTSLTSLFCARNQLVSLDVSYNTALITLFCSFNLLTSLDVSHNTKLRQLICNADGNQITSLDLSNNVELTWLDCTANPLGSLDVSHNLLLENLRCDKTELTSLDVSQNIALKALYCSSNHIDSLDVTQNVNLTELNCEGNGMTKLSLIDDKVFNYLYCASNKLTFESLETIVESMSAVDTTHGNLRAVIVSMNDKNSNSNPVYLKSSTIGSEMFHYAPQDSLGYKKIIAKKAGESFTYGFYVGGKHSVYQWYKNGTKISSQTSAALSFTALSKEDGGEYTLHVKNTLLPELTLYSRPMTLKVDNNTGNNELSDPCFTFYPNPAEDQLIINAGQGCVVVIYDLNGKTIMKRNISAGMSELDISKIEAGSYILKMISENKIVTSKFVKIQR